MDSWVFSRATLVKSPANGTTVEPVGPQKGREVEAFFVA